MKRLTGKPEDYSIFLTILFVAVTYAYILVKIVFW